MMTTMMRSGACVCASTNARPPTRPGLIAGPKIAAAAAFVTSRSGRALVVRRATVATAERPEEPNRRDNDDKEDDDDDDDDGNAAKNGARFWHDCGAAKGDGTANAKTNAARGAFGRAWGDLMHKRRRVERERIAALIELHEEAVTGVRRMYAKEVEAASGLVNGNGASVSLDDFEDDLEDGEKGGEKSDEKVRDA